MQKAILAIFSAASLATVSAWAQAPDQTTSLAEPAPIPPPVEDAMGVDPMTTAPLRAESGTTAPGAAAGARADATTVTSVPSRSMNDFQGDDVATVLRLLARQAKLNLVVSDAVTQSQMTVTMRLEDKDPSEVIDIIVRSKGLVMDEIDGVRYVKTPQEKVAEPTEAAFYIFSYAQAANVLPLLQAQLGAGAPPQVDARTNAVFYRVASSQKDSLALFLETIDRPTRQVMIEARLVEVTANPRQAYGINWAGVLGNRTLTAGASGVNTFAATTAQTTIINPATGVVTTTDRIDPATGLPVVGPVATEFAAPTLANGAFSATDFLFDLNNVAKGALSAVGGQFAILSTNQLSATLNLINQDQDAEFLANPRIVTADNQEASIKITRNQPVPQLNFNEQTATAVFGGFEDKTFGNTLLVRPSINKDDFITMSVKPEISNKVGDATFTFAGATVASPVIDTRSLESNVLIKSGDTLAIGGLLQDEVGKARTKVPVLGDIPVLGYLFQERVNTRTKRNLLVFVTPTIIQSGYGTGLEDQVSGVHHSGEEFADPNGWRNNARGAIRLVPTSHRQVTSDYPKPGTPLPPETVPVNYKASAFGRER